MLKLGIALNRTQKRIVTGTNFDPTAQAFITAAGITDPNQRNAINDLTIGLKLANIFNKIPCLYPMVGPNATAHTFNLINVATFQLTFLGGWTFTAGAKPNGVNAYATTNFKPSINFSTPISNSGFGFYTNTNVITTSCSLGVYENANNAYHFSDNNGSFNVNGDIAGNASYTATDSRGHNLIQKFTTADVRSYKNGIQQAISTFSPNLKVAALQFYIGALSANSVAQFFAPHNLETVHMHNDLTAGEISTLYTLIFNYNTSLSRA
jgi:hypothetical protein